MEEKGRWRLWCDMPLIGKQLDQIGRGVGPKQGIARTAMYVRFLKRNNRIGENQKIWPRAFSFDGIATGSVPLIKMSSDSRCEMAARGKSPYAYSVRINAKLSSMRAGPTYRPLPVLHFNRMMIFRA